MARCSGCSSDRCSCVIRPGANVSITGVGSPTNPYVISSQGEEGQAVPSGSLVMYAGDVVPAGWLLCNGAQVSRTTYAALYAAIGVAYGAGDGSTTFGIPDLRDRFPIGVSATKPRGTMAGAASHVMTVQNLVRHQHDMTHTHAAGYTASMNRNQVHSHPQVVTAAVAAGGAIRTDYTGDSAGAASFDQGASTYGANTDHEHYFQTPTFSGSTGITGSTNPTPDPIPTLPPYTAVNFLIKT